jgi:hypothetical protein
MLEKVKEYIYVRATAGLSSSVCDKAKMNRKIIPAIKDNNGTIITDTMENANILNSYYESVSCCDRNITEIKLANSVKPSILTKMLKITKFGGKKISRDRWSSW